MQLQHDLLDRMSFNNKLPSLQSVFSKKWDYDLYVQGQTAKQLSRNGKKIDQRGKHVSAVIIFCRTYQHFIVYIAAECQQSSNL